MSGVGARGSERELATIPSHLLEPAHYAAVRLPVDRAETLPAWCYGSAEFYAREIERIFMLGWHFVGRADLVAAPGDYLTVDTPGGRSSCSGTPAAVWASSPTPAVTAEPACSREAGRAEPSSARTIAGRTDLTAGSWALPGCTIAPASTGRTGA